MNQRSTILVNADLQSLPMNQEMYNTGQYRSAVPTNELEIYNTSQ